MVYSIGSVENDKPSLSKPNSGLASIHASNHCPPLPACQIQYHPNRGRCPSAWAPLIKTIVPSSCKVPPYGPITGWLGRGGRSVDRGIAETILVYGCHSVCGEINVGLRQFGIIEKTFQYPAISPVGGYRLLQGEWLIRSRVTSDRLSMNNKLIREI